MPVEHSQQTDAEKLEGLKRRLVMQLGSLGPGHKETAQTIYSVGELQLRLREYREAEESLKNCLKIRKRVVGEYTQETAHTLGLLGQVYHGIGESLLPKEQIAIERNFKLAIKFYRRSLVVLEHLHGGLHPDCMLMLHQIATLCDKTGEQEQASVCKHRCLQIVQGVDKQSLRDIEGHLNRIHGTVGTKGAEAAEADGGKGAEVRQHAVRMEELIKQLEAHVTGHMAGGDAQKEEAAIEQLQEEINEEIEQIENVIEGVGSTQGSLRVSELGGDRPTFFSAGTLQRTSDLSESLSNLLQDKDSQMRVMGNISEGDSKSNGSRHITPRMNAAMEVEQGACIHEDYKYMSSGSEDLTPAPRRRIVTGDSVVHKSPTSGAARGRAVTAAAGHGSGGSECHASGEMSDDPFLSNHEEAKRTPPASARTRQWVIQINRAAGEELGVAMNRHGVIRQLKPHGLIFEWNEWNPSMKVREGDRFVEVNGRQGEMAVVSELQELSVLDITVCRESLSDRHGRESCERAEATAAESSGGDRAGCDCVVS